MKSLVGIVVALTLAGTELGRSTADATAGQEPDERRARLERAIAERETELADLRARLAEQRARLEDQEKRDADRAMRERGRDRDGRGYGGDDDAPEAREAAREARERAKEVRELALEQARLVRERAMGSGRKDREKALANAQRVREEALANAREVRERALESGREDRVKALEHAREARARALESARQPRSSFGLREQRMRSDGGHDDSDLLHALDRLAERIESLEARRGSSRTSAADRDRRCSPSRGEVRWTTVAPAPPAAPPGLDALLRSIEERLRALEARPGCECGDREDEDDESDPFSSLRAPSPRSLAGATALWLANRPR